MAESVRMTEFWQQKAAECQEEVKRLEDEKSEAERHGDRAHLPRIEARLGKIRARLLAYLTGLEAAKCLPGA